MKILWVEDDLDQQGLAKAALQKSNGKAEFTFLDDGAKALRYLKKQAPYESSDVPDLVILDLHLPNIDGQTLLREIKQDPSSRAIPVIVFSQSQDRDDLINCYTNGANCYIVKPKNLKTYIEFIGQLEHFWSNVVSIP